VSLRRVVNASPIIFLHRVGLLEQLSERGVTVLVPDAVLEELGGLRSDDPAAVAVRSAPWVQVVATPPFPNSLPRFRLDRGEAAVIALALLASEHETEVVLDDLAARRCAAALGLKVCGSLSFLLIAKAEGRIPSVRPLIEELRRGGMRLSADLVRHVLDLAGE
jgi:predicted nucleic acid-binding protein